MTRVLRLAFLSPAVTEAILAGTQRGGLDGTLLLATGAVDPGWDVQARGLLPRAGGPGAAVPISVGQAPLRLLTENR